MSRPIAVFDATPLALGERNGVARFAREVLSRVHARGSFEWVVAAPRAFAEGLPRGLALEAGEEVGASSPFLWRRTALRRILRGRGAGVLFSPVAALPFGRIPCPAVATVHDVPWARRSEVPRADVSLRKRLSLSHTVRCAARIVVPSEATRRDLVALLPRAGGRVRVVPLGVSDAFRAEPVPVEEARRARRRLGVPDGPYILGLGLLRGRKSPEFLLDVLAAALLGPDERLVLVMTGDAAIDRDALLDRATSRGLAGRLVATGHVPDEDLATLLDGAVALAVPSALEGFGLPAVEAMARGVPVLASDRGALPEVVGDAGIVLPFGETAAWAGELRDLLRDEKKRRALGEKGRARAARYDWNETADGVLAAIEEALRA